MEISLAAEQVGTLFYGKIPITNSLILTWVAMALILIVGLVIKNRSKIVPMPLQNLVEAFVEGGYKFIESILDDRLAPKVFPIAISLFIFIALGNLGGLLPGVGSIMIDSLIHGEQRELPLFRALTADLNLTFALAIVAIGVNQYFTVKEIGFKKYLHKYFNFSSPINFFVGVLEIISELSKILSFSFRLFGNVFAGEVLLTVMYFLIPIAIPIPFLIMEIFVGLIQAFVFSLLFVVFIKVATAEE